MEKSVGSITRTDQRPQRGSPAEDDHRKKGDKKGDGHSKETVTKREKTRETHPTTARFALDEETKAHADLGTNAGSTTVEHKAAIPRETSAKSHTGDSASMMSLAEVQTNTGIETDGEEVVETNRKTAKSSKP